nr:unnamed protein product [Callosobruchus analis]
MFPKRIGALDCTHIEIQSPGGYEAEMFRNRKGFFAYNVHTVYMLYRTTISELVCRWPVQHMSHRFSKFIS